MNQGDMSYTQIIVKKRRLRGVLRRGCAYFILGVKMEN